MSSTKSNPYLRLRVFAGPNGSGKSTIISDVREHKLSGQKVDFGIYVNADDIATNLLEDKFSFKDYKIEVTPTEFRTVATSSGLLKDDFSVDEFEGCYHLRSNEIKLKESGIANSHERIAQIIAHFLRIKLLNEKKKFSFETVFSHTSKLDVMREAYQAGYKVYLYFVSTESPEINKYRVAARVKKGGHPVPEDKIEKRYFRSLDLLFDAAQYCYQAYFIDNSKDASEGEYVAKWFAHFKLVQGKKQWDDINESDVPEWFKKYYFAKAAALQKSEQS